MTHPEMWIGYKNGSPIYALRGQSEVDKAITQRRIDSGSAVSQYEGGQRNVMERRWAALPFCF